MFISKQKVKELERRLVYLEMKDQLIRTPSKELKELAQALGYEWVSEAKIVTTPEAIEVYGTLVVKKPVYSWKKIKK